MWKKAFILLSTAVLFFLVGCAASAKINIPNMGITKFISWESIQDPNYGGGYIQVLTFRDTERNKDYFIVESADGDIAVHERK